MPCGRHFVEATATMGTRNAVVQFRVGWWRWRQLARWTASCKVCLRLACGLHCLPQRFGLVPPFVSWRRFWCRSPTASLRSLLGSRALGNTVSSAVKLAPLLLGDFDANSRVALESMNREESAAMMACGTLHVATIVTLTIRIGVRVAISRGCITRNVRNTDPCRSYVVWFRHIV